MTSDAPREAVRLDCPMCGGARRVRVEASFILPADGTVGQMRGCPRCIPSVNADTAPAFRLSNGDIIRHRGSRVLRGTKKGVEKIAACNEARATQARAFLTERRPA